jgi:hypothetical protein
LQRYEIVEADPDDPEVGIDPESSAFVRRWLTLAQDLLRPKKNTEPERPAH